MPLPIENYSPDQPCNLTEKSENKLVNLIVFVANISPDFYLFKVDSETYTHSLNIQKEFQMSTAKRQNIDGGCKQEFTLKTEKY